MGKSRGSTYRPPPARPVRRDAPLQTSQPTALRPPVRAGRAAVLLAVAVGLGLSGHVPAGGQVSILALLIAAVMAAPLAWHATACERGAAAIAGLLGLVQVLVHGAGALVVVPGGTGAAAHVGHGAALTHGSPLPMVAVHLGATVLSVLWLRLAERRLWRLAHRALRRLPAVRGSVPRPLVLPAPLATHPALDAVVAWRIRGGDALAFRGPPAARPVSR